MLLEAVQPSWKFVSVELECHEHGQQRASVWTIFTHQDKIMNRNPSNLMLSFLPRPCCRGETSPDGQHLSVGPLECKRDDGMTESKGFSS